MNFRNSVFILSLYNHISGRYAMTRLTAKDFPQELLDYYDYYAHGKINKREFLNLAARYAVGGVTALALFNMLKPNYALAEQVKFTDPDILPVYIQYPSDRETTRMNSSHV